MLSPLLSPQSQTKVILDIAFYVLATIYILEILLNWIAFGLVTYLKDSYWNVLSFFVTSVNIISLTLNSQQFVLNFIDSLRILVFIKIGAVKYIFYIFYLGIQSWNKICTISTIKYFCQNVLIDHFCFLSINHLWNFRCQIIERKILLLRCIYFNL